MKKTAKILLTLYFFVIIFSVIYYNTAYIKEQPMVVVTNAVTENFSGYKEFKMKVVNIKENTISAEIYLSPMDYNYKHYKLYEGEEVLVNYNYEKVKGSISEVDLSKGGTTIKIQFSVNETSNININDTIIVSNEKKETTFSNVVDENAIITEDNGLQYVYVVKKQNGSFGEGFYLSKERLAYVPQLYNRCSLVFSDDKMGIVHFPIVLNPDINILKHGMQVNLTDTN